MVLRSVLSLAGTLDLVVSFRKGMLERKFVGVVAELGSGEGSRLVYLWQFVRWRPYYGRILGQVAFLGGRYLF